MKRYKRICFLIIFLIVFCLLSSCAPKIFENIDEAASPLLTQNAVINIETQNKLNESAEDFIKYGLIDKNDYSADNFVSRIVAVQMICDITGLIRKAENGENTHPFIDFV